MKSGIFTVLLFLSALLLPSCVAGNNGQKKFDPWEGAVRMDKHVDDWLENRDYPTQRSAPSAPPAGFNHVPKTQ
ncbi:MAG: hypothetical protein ABIP32_11915 [Chthoniobacterales bacterium]